MLNTEEAQAAYDELVAELATTGKPYEDAGYCFMKLRASDAAAWLRTVPDSDFIDMCGLANDALQAHLVKILETAGPERDAAEQTFLTWLRHRAIVSVSAHIAKDVHAYEPPMMLRRQAF